MYAAKRKLYLRVVSDDAIGASKNRILNVENKVCVKILIPVLFAFLKHKSTPIVMFFISVPSAR